MTPNQIRTYLGMAAGAAALGLGIVNRDPALIAIGATLTGAGPSYNTAMNGNGKKNKETANGQA